MKMYRKLTIFILALSCLCEGAIFSKRETSNEVSKDQPEVQGSTTPQVSSQTQTYSSLQASRVPPSGQQFYPSFSDYPTNGYNSQSRYEGYLIPAGASPQRTTHWATEIAETFFPFSSQLLIYGARLSVYALHFLLVVVLGGAFTTILCTLTPLCSISFHGFDLSRNEVKEQVAELARMYITPETINAATVLVSKAIDKYAMMQHEKDESFPNGSLVK